MKKFRVSSFILGLVALVFVLGTGIVLSACGHKHSFGEWQVETAATCTTDGVEKRVCSCGEFETRPITATGHTFGEWTITKGATCTEEGSQEHTCSVCLTVVSEVIAKTDHVPMVVVDAKEPTCTEAGNTEETICSECYITLQESTPIAATGHTFGEWIEFEKATCSHDGRDLRRCDVCSHIEYREVTVPHSWGAWQIDEDEPRMHKHICDECGTEQSFECSFSDEQTVSATCTDPGETFMICTECQNKVVLNTTDALGHDFKKYTEVIVPNEKEQGHKHEHYQHCERCGYDTEYEACTLVYQETVAETCVTAEYDINICEKCGSIHEDSEGKKPAKGHTWTYQNVDFYDPTEYYVVTSTHIKTCETCHEQIEERCKIEHNYYISACEQDAYHLYECPYCKDSGGRYKDVIRGTALKHNLSDWTFDGTSKEDAHHFRKCLRTNCSFVEEGPCDFDTTSTEPTCTAAGKVDYACKYCHEGFSEQSAIATGHSWEEGWHVYEQDTTKHYHKCLACNEIQIDSHDYDVYEDPADCGKNAQTRKVCRQCEDTQITVKEGTARQHIWSTSNITETQHTVHCSLCLRDVTENHDWKESNICAICSHDGLTYRTEGEHAILVKSEKINAAKTKNIIVNKTYRKLGEDGQYETKEYPVITVESAFFMNTSIEHVTLPETVTIIKANSFSNCTRLQTVEFSGEKPSLEKIDNMAFYACTALSSFRAPETLNFIGEYAFSNCTNLSEITIPEDSEVDIELRAFSNTKFEQNSTNWQNDMLYLGKHLIKARQSQKDDGSYLNTTISVKDGTLTIAANAFSDCHELLQITLPETLKHIDRDAFLNCTKLSKVEFDGDIYQWLSIIFANDYASPLCYGDTGLHVVTVGQDGVVDLTDESVVNRVITHIPAGTFRKTNLKKIILPSTVTYIGQEAFEDCAELEKITFKDGCNVSYVGKDVLKGSKYYDMSENWQNNEVLYIDNKILVEAKSTLTGAYTVQEGTTVIMANAFEGCNQLTEITMSESLLYVGASAFSGCSALSKITFPDTSYVWLCHNPNLMISRGLSGDKLNYDYLSNYAGEWRRTYKETPKE